MAEKRNDLDLGEKPVDETKERAGGKWNEATFLQIVRENVAEAQTYWADNWDRARDDVRFAQMGKQWPAEAVSQRKVDDRPILTFNDLPQFINQVVNDQRMNRPSINVRPGDDIGATQEIETTDGKNKLKTAEVLEGLVRNIESRSQASAHYDTAHQHAVDGGFGWLRVLTEYSSPGSFDLDICIRSIPNRWSVLIDPNAQEPDLSDADWGLIGDEMPRHQFEKLYPEAVVGDLTEYSDYWAGDKRVRVAEYYERYPVRRTLLQLSSGVVAWRDEIEDALDELASSGVNVVRERVVDTYKVRWFKVTANSVLRGPVDIPCSTIPIVPVFGTTVNIDGNLHTFSLIYHAKDPKQADNFWMTAATERVAMAPNTPWLVTDAMIKNHESKWESANRGSPAYLSYNESANGNIPKREAPPMMPAAELQMAAAMTEKVKSTIGMYDAGLGKPSNETSGKAILARQRESDVGSFTFTDNLVRAMERIGRILVEMIPVVYDTERVVRVLNADGTGHHVALNKTVRDERTGKDVVIHDLAVGQYDVVVKTGPAFSTLRAEAAEALMEFMRVAPNTAALIVDKVADAMDWPGAQEIRRRLLYTIPRHMLTPGEIEIIGDDTPDQPPTPDQQAEAARAEATVAQAEATKAMAEAKSAEAQVKMAEIGQGAANNEFMADVRDLIVETITQVLKGAEQ